LEPTLQTPSCLKSHPKPKSFPMNQIHNTTKKEVEKTKHHPTLEHNKNNHRELKKRRTVNNTTLD